MDHTGRQEADHVFVLLLIRKQGEARDGNSTRIRGGHGDREQGEQYPAGFGEGSDCLPYAEQDIPRRREGCVAGIEGTGRDDDMKWYAAKSAVRGQGLVIDEDTGRNVAVVYDEKDTKLLAAAPRLLEVLELIAASGTDNANVLRRHAEDVIREAGHEQTT